MYFRGEYAFLSNMFSAPMHVNGLTFTCAEACFQSFKCLDKEARKQFQGLAGPEAKRLGRKVALRPDWNDIKVDVMREVIRVKFKQNPELMAKLKDIQGEIVEDNTWSDLYWGKCNGIGYNKLGIILMELRDKQ